MHCTQIRNATLRLDYGGQRFLIDPMLADQGAFPGFAGTMHSETANPTVPLPVPVEQLFDVDAVLVTHTHPDHWDEAARTLLPKDLPVFAQNERDAAEIREAGFVDVRVLGERTDFAGVTLSKTAGRHGSADVMHRFGAVLGEVCGIVFHHPQEKTLYLAGDTVWYEEVAATLEQHRPEVIIVNCGDARLLGDQPIIMNEQDLLALAAAAPQALIMASHLEAVNHAALTRARLRAVLAEHGLTGRVLVPEDGAAMVC